MSHPLIVSHAFKSVVPAKIEKIKTICVARVVKQTKRSNYNIHDDIGVSFGPKELILQVLLLLLLFSFHCIDCECVRRESTGINRGRENQQA